MKGAIYARHSSDNQREESIEGQWRENHTEYYEPLVEKPPLYGGI